MSSLCTRPGCFGYCYTYQPPQDPVEVRCQETSDKVVCTVMPLVFCMCCGAGFTSSGQDLILKPRDGNPSCSNSLVYKSLQE